MYLCVIIPIKGAHIICFSNNFEKIKTQFIIDNETETNIIKFSAFKRYEYLVN